MGSTSTQSSKGSVWYWYHCSASSCMAAGDDLYSSAPSRPAAKSASTSWGFFT